MTVMLAILVAFCVLVAATYWLLDDGDELGGEKQPKGPPPCFCATKTPQEMAENGCHDCGYRAACDPDGSVGDFALGAQDAQEDIEALGIDDAWRKHVRQVDRDGAMTPYTRGYRRGLANYVHTTNQKLAEGERS